MRDEQTQQAEGAVARRIEQQTAKLPSDTFLWLALGAMGTSAALQLNGSRHLSLFFGQWVPAFLLFGVYNKLVKQLGSDRVDQSGPASPRHERGSTMRTSPYEPSGLSSPVTSLS